MTKVEFLAKSEQAFAENGLSAFATAEFGERFYALTSFLLEQNRKMNLTAIRDEASFLTRHIADCLFATEFFPEGAKVLDVGSGGGMPTLPLAIARPDLSITALDATAKKTAAIAEMAAALSLSNVTTLTGRAEELGQMSAYREQYDVVCARAVAELRVLAEWCAPFAKKGGLFLAMKGKNALAERDAAKNAAKVLSLSLLSENKRVLLERDEDGAKTENERYLLLFRKTAPTPKLYPRRNAAIQKSPL